MYFEPISLYDICIYTIKNSCLLILQGVISSLGLYIRKNTYTIFTYEHSYNTLKWFYVLFCWRNKMWFSFVSFKRCWGWRNLKFAVYWSVTGDIVQLRTHESAESITNYKFCLAFHMGICLEHIKGLVLHFYVYNIIQCKYYIILAVFEMPHMFYIIPIILVDRSTLMDGTCSNLRTLCLWHVPWFLPLNPLNLSYNITDIQEKLVEMNYTKQTHLKN